MFTKDKRLLLDSCFYKTKLCRSCAFKYLSKPWARLGQGLLRYIKAQVSVRHLKEQVKVTKLVICLIHHYESNPLGPTKKFDQMEPFSDILHPMYKIPRSLPFIGMESTTVKSRSF